MCLICFYFNFCFNPNITSVIRGIPKEKYENIFKGAYNRDAVYVKNKTRKRKLKNYKV